MTLDPTENTFAGTHTLSTFNSAIDGLFITSTSLLTYTMTLGMKFSYSVPPEMSFAPK